MPDKPPGKSGPSPGTAAHPVILIQVLLTYMFTLSRLVAQTRIEQWALPDHSPPRRILWITPRWIADFNALPASPPRSRSLTRRPGPGDALGALASAFVRGDPKSHLIRPP